MEFEVRQQDEILHEFHYLVWWPGIWFLLALVGVIAFGFWTARLARRRWNKRDDKTSS